MKIIPILYLMNMYGSLYKSISAKLYNHILEDNVEDKLYLIPYFTTFNKLE
jgi:hypothetical protein